MEARVQESHPPYTLRTHCTSRIRVGVNPGVVVSGPPANPSNIGIVSPDLWILSSIEVVVEEVVSSSK